MPTRTRLAAFVVAAAATAIGTVTPAASVDGPDRHAPAAAVHSR